MVDEVFGPYLLQELRGRGGMGEVYRAYHTEQERVVALKVLLPDLSDDEVFRRRFLRESRLAAKLTDPHVVPVHNWGEVDGRLFLDMRFVEGEDLAARLARAGALPPRLAVDVVAQVARALDAAHAIDLVHRDVKPSNVLLTGSGHDGDPGFAYLADFGIARMTHSEGSNGATTGGVAVGTVAYMAPERFLGEDVDRAGDVYALACVLHECLTGARPFRADEALAVISAHLHAEPPRPSRFDPRVPATLDEVVAVGMAKAPADRFPSAGALAGAAWAAVSAPDRAGAPRRSAVTAAASAGAPPVPPFVAPRAAAPPAAEQHQEGGPAAVLPDRGRHPSAQPPAVGVPSPGMSPALRPPARANNPGWARAGRPRHPLPLTAVLLLVGVVAGVLMLAPPATSPAGPQPTTTPAPVSTDADRALLAALPPGFTSATCGADPERPTAATAALQCGEGPADGPGSAEFVRFADVTTLDRFVAEDAQRRHLPFDTGNCRDGVDVQTTWSKNGQVAGLLTCYADPTRGRTLRWTDRAALAMGVITRRDGNSAALYDWWTRYDFGAS